MVLIWGERLCGKVDHVLGFYYVKTKFFHLYWLPLIPMGSVLILDGSESDNGYRGVSVPLSFKSMMMAWVRTAALMGGIGLAIACFAHVGKWQRQPDHLPILLLTVCATFLVAALGYVAFTLTHATPHRAAELAEHIGLDPNAVFAHVNGDHVPMAEAAPQANPFHNHDPNATFTPVNDEIPMAEEIPEVKPVDEHDRRY